MSPTSLGSPDESSATKSIIWPETRRAPIADQPDLEISAIHSDLPPSARAHDPAVVIDEEVIGMLKALQFPNDEEKFSDRIALSLEKVGANLKKARITAGRLDGRELEEAACELSKNALMIGAVNLMKGSYELQACARRADWESAMEAISVLEIEYFRAQQGLKVSVR